MKKFAKQLLAGFSFLMLVSTASAQTYSFVGGKVQYFYPNATGSMDCAIHIKNESSSPLKLKYKKVSIDYPSKWDVSFCDNVNCNNSFGDSGTMFDIPAGDQESSLKVSTYPNGYADTAIVQYAIWDVNNPANIDTMVFNIYVRWGVGVNNLSSLDGVYPNPAKNQINVIGNASVNRVRLFSITGSEMNISTVQTRFGMVVNVANLPNGIYSLVYLDGTKEKNVRVVVEN